MASLRSGDKNISSWQRAYVRIPLGHDVDGLCAGAGVVTRASDGAAMTRAVRPLAPPMCKHSNLRVKLIETKRPTTGPREP